LISSGNAGRPAPVRSPTARARSTPDAPSSSSPHDAIASAIVRPAIAPLRITETAAPPPPPEVLVLARSAISQLSPTRAPGATALPNRARRDPPHTFSLRIGSNVSA
jgi:hypothetical protein